MEKCVVLLIPLLWAVALIRLLLMPLKWVIKVLLHSACGFLCLWMLNLLAPFTGITLGINAVTVLTAGVFGLPGIAVISLLAIC